MRGICYRSEPSSGLTINMKLIELSGKYGIGKFAQVDDEDYDYLIQWKWNTGRPERGLKYAGRMPWIKGKGRGGRIKMHRVIMGVTDPKILVDHVDRNPLNNQRSNLRIATASQNCSNVGPKSAKYKGVYKKKYPIKSGETFKWAGKCMKDRRGYYTKLCETPEEAALEYNKLAIKLHGEFAWLNTIMPNEDSMEAQAFQVLDKLKGYDKPIGKN